MTDDLLIVKRTKTSKYGPWLITFSNKFILFHIFHQKIDFFFKREMSRNFIFVFKADSWVNIMKKGFFLLFSLITTKPSLNGENPDSESLNTSSNLSDSLNKPEHPEKHLEYPKLSSLKETIKSKLHTSRTNLSNLADNLKDSLQSNSNSNSKEKTESLLESINNVVREYEKFKSDVLESAERSK